MVKRKSAKYQKSAKFESDKPDVERVEGTAQDIFEELEIPQRTQWPPSADLIARLNEIASKPPFSYIHKIKEHEIR
jgi:hypothetical protein